jgi:hypothetical protein
MESHPSLMAFQPYDRHHNSDNTPSHPCELLATIILYTISFVQYISPHNVLQLFLRVLLLK